MLCKRATTRFEMATGCECNRRDKKIGTDCARNSTITAMSVATLKFSGKLFSVVSRWKPFGSERVPQGSS